MVAAARKIALTDRSLRALKPAPEGARYTVWDALMPGLAVRVSAKGKRSFYAVRARAGSTQVVWIFLGAYPVMTLGEARDRAREPLKALGDGLDPAALAAKKRRAKEEAERDREEKKFAAVAEAFIRRYAMTKRSGAETAAVIRRELIPAWGEKQIDEITRRDVVRLIEAIIDRGGADPGPGRRRKSGGPYAARHAYAIAHKLFSWAVGRDLIQHSPCERIEAAELHGSPEARDRVLTDEEIRWVWQAAEATSYPYGPLVKMLLLTGQRREEISEARWSEIAGLGGDEPLLTVSAERMKGKVAHTVPLTPAAAEVLAAVPRFTKGDFLFSGQVGGRPFSGFSKAKDRLDRAIEALARKERGLPVKDDDYRADLGLARGAPLPRLVPAFTLHDLRRTVRTRLSSAGVLPIIAELVIGHKQQGIAAVYDRHRYDAEKRDALMKWEAKLLALVAPEPEPDNVVTLPTRARA